MSVDLSEITELMNRFCELIRYVDNENITYITETYLKRFLQIIQDLKSFHDIKLALEHTSLLKAKLFNDPVQYETDLGRLHKARYNFLKSFLLAKFGSLDKINRFQHTYIEHHEHKNFCLSADDKKTYKLVAEFYDLEEELDLLSDDEIICGEMADQFLINMSSLISVIKREILHKRTTVL